jgi:hypothetical protein
MSVSDIHRHENNLILDIGIASISEKIYFNIFFSYIVLIRPMLDVEYCRHNFQRLSSPIVVNRFILIIFTIALEIQEQYGFSFIFCCPNQQFPHWTTKIGVLLLNYRSIKAIDIICIGQFGWRYL